MRERADGDAVDAGLGDGADGLERDAAARFERNAAARCAATASRSWSGIMLSRRMKSGASASASSSSRMSRTSTMIFCGICRRADALDRRGDRAGAVDVVVLHQEHVVEADAMVLAAAGLRPRTCRARAGPARSCACRGSSPASRPRRRRSAASSVAMPEARCMRFSAVRSPDRSAITDACTSATMSPGSHRVAVARLQHDLGRRIERPEHRSRSTASPARTPVRLDQKAGRAAIGRRRRWPRW